MPYPLPPTARSSDGAAIYILRYMFFLLCICKNNDNNDDDDDDDRLAGYLAFLWTNVAVGWAVVVGAGGSAAATFRAWWWLLLLAVMTSLSLVSLSTTNPGKIPADDVDACPASASEGRVQLAQVCDFASYRIFVFVVRVPRTSRSTVFVCFCSCEGMQVCNCGM